MKKLYTTILILFVIVISIPFLQMHTEIINLKPLKGAITKTKKPTFHFNNWLNIKYQDSVENYVKDHIGCYSLFIRIRNQISYSIFNEAKARDVVIGINNYLFEKNYIDAYNGDDFIGEDSIKARVKRIVSIDNYLKSKNKTLIICFAAGKGSYYPDYFPDKDKKKATDRTNYKQYVKALSKTNVNLLDLNRWFLQMKDTSKFILFPKYSIHWSYYGEFLVTDSLVRYVEHLRNEDLPNIELKSYEIWDKPKPTDQDIVEGMNLLFRYKEKPFCYPKYIWQNSVGKTKPKTIVVSDSFYWQIFNNQTNTKAFSLGGFWYYNYKIYPDSYKKPTRVYHKNIVEEIENNDIFIIMATEANLKSLGWGFLDNDIFKELDN
ncbi:MAG: hypothetical protein JEZ09_05620 [Salinivirgaceae bacterium]|nr:hypothetical protein [Salinivirgaceae bacterium]